MIIIIVHQGVGVVRVYPPSGKFFRNNLKGGTKVKFTPLPWKIFIGKNLKGGTKVKI
jgi:hypothetical protein